MKLELESSYGNIKSTTISLIRNSGLAAGSNCVCVMVIPGGVSLGSWDHLSGNKSASKPEGFHVLPQISFNFYSTMKTQ